MQRKPRFSGILLVAVLMVVVLLFVSLSPLVAASASKHVNYSDIYYYFQNQQVTSYRLDRNTNVLEMWLKEGKKPLPEDTSSTADLPSGGLLTNLSGSQDDDDELPANGGTVYVSYKLPYGGDFNTGKITEFVDAYNEANPDAPMIFDYVAVKTSVPWLEIIFYSVMLGSVGMLFMSMYRGGAGGGIMNVGRAKVKDQQESQRKATFADVAGADEEKEELQEVVEFLKAPGKFNTLGARIPHGVLLVGPPGTGKTLLARACAGEAGVPFYAISGSDFVEMYVGVGASRVRDLFEKAKKTMPSIVFIDEIDAVGRQRGAGLGGGHDEREQTLNQLLTEMDGFDAAKGVVILAATNRPESLDPALTRPGRFDRRVPVELPDLKGRESILRLHAKKVKLGPDCDFSVVARMTPGASGAELANIVNEAALCAVRHRRKAVTQFDLQEAVDTILAGAQKKNKILNNKEKCIVSYHEVGHALVAALQTNSAPVQKITIVPRTSGALGFTMQVEDGDHTLMTKEEILNKIATLTGGRAAEELIFHSITTGASNDIEQATKLARALVTRYGMTEDFDMVALETVNNAYLGGDASLACSEQTAAKVDAKVVELVQAEHRKAYKLLADNKRKLDEIAQYLYEKETISGEEFMRILNAQPQLPAGTSADSTNTVQ